ncbi:MAG: c-type cytochrome biogenesis protein CcmI/CycH [Myxococcota bacterium]
MSLKVWPLLVAALAGCALLLACDRNLEPFDPDVEPSTPDLSKIFPAPPDNERPGQETAGMETPTRGTASGEGIRGRVVIGSAGTGGAPAGSTLFIIARPAGATAGPPLAVQRIPAPSFPVDFEIGPQNVMIPSMKFEGEITLTARLDSDGNAMTRLPGDLQGSYGTPVRPGSAGVEIRLDERI